jgi:hypothetical protein
LAIATETPPRLFEPPDRQADHRPTLEDAILATWHELAADGRAACPVCGARMRAGAACEGCGSEIS